MPRLSQSGEEIRILGISFPIHRYGDGRVISWYYQGSKRVRVTRRSEADLREALRDAAVIVSNGNLDRGEIDNSEARAMIAAREALAPYQVPIDVAAREYASARQLLGSVGLLEAARFYHRHAGDRLRERTVAAVVTEFLVAKSGLSLQYQEQLKKDLTRFVLTFGERLVSEVESAEISNWVHGTERTTKKGKKLRPGAKRKNQLTATVGTLFAFARTQNYLVRGKATEAEMVPKSKHVRGDILILSPTDLQLLLEITAQHDREWLPFLALAAFAGIRTNTLQRLEWRVMHWDRTVLQIPAAKSKISRRYLPPLLPSTAAWLRDWRDAPRNAYITPRENPRYFQQRLARRAGWAKWPKNVLRKSFISYRMAALKSAAAVALEANTSEKEIFENYREVCTIGGDALTAEMAALYFGIMPEQPSNVVPMQGHLAL